MMIPTTGSLSIVDLPGLSRAVAQNRADAARRLDAQVQEIVRLADPSLGRRQSGRSRSATSRSAGKPVLDTFGYYDIRRRATVAGQAERAEEKLPEPRSPLCRSACMAQGSSTPDWCSGDTCKAHSLGARAREDFLAQQRLQVERGRTPAPRPRSIQDVTRDFWAARNDGGTGGQVVGTSPRGGR